MDRSNINRLKAKLTALLLQIIKYLKKQILCQYLRYATKQTTRSFAPEEKVLLIFSPTYKKKMNCEQYGQRPEKKEGRRRRKKEEEDEDDQHKRNLNLIDVPTI